MARVRNARLSRLTLLLLAGGQLATWTLVSALPGCDTPVGLPATCQTMTRVTIVRPAPGAVACTAIDNPCVRAGWSQTDTFAVSHDEPYFVETVRDQSETQRSLCARAEAPIVVDDPVSATYTDSTLSGAPQAGFLVTVTGASCGNTIVEPPAEQCDDGNTVGGDGCSGTCQLEECRPEGTPCSAHFQCCLGNCTNAGVCLSTGTPGP